MRVEVSEVINRPVATVFHFYAHNHVANHPRWDPMMELEQISDGPIGVGTVIRRRHTHFSEPIDGTMEVVEFEDDKAMGVVIHDGDAPEARGRMTCRPIGYNETELTISADLPGVEESTDSSSLEAMIRTTVTNIKRLLESETDEPPSKESAARR